MLQGLGGGGVGWGRAELTSRDGRVAVTGLGLGFRV